MSTKPALPAEKVSRNPKSSSCKPVRIAVVTTYGDTRIEISCGWSKSHPRAKVREDAAQRHLDKKHGGSGMWL